MTETGPFDLTLMRRLTASRHAVWRCWTEPELLKQWFCPLPWSVWDCRIDLRPGGEFFTMMQGPNGESHGNPGVYLDVAPMERLVFTNALGPDWRPVSLQGFGMTAHVSFRDDAGGGTVYSVRVLHKDAADRDAHAAIGFEGGWGTAAAQMDALAVTL